MPYRVKKVKGKKRFAIINQRNGAIVGYSNSLDKANRSIEYRLEAEAKSDLKN